MREIEIENCGLVATGPMMTSLETLLAECNEDFSYDLNALTQKLSKEFELPNQNAMHVFFQALCKIAEGVCAPGSVPSLTIAGNIDDGGEKDEHIEVFKQLLSPLLASTSICPDFWVKTDFAGHQNLPVLMFEIAEKNDAYLDDCIKSVQQSLLEAACSAIDLIRLYMNVLKSDVAYMQMSTIVIPKMGAENMSSAVCVTAEWGVEADWQFQVSFTPIGIDDFVRECTNILSKQFRFITEQVLDPCLCSKYLVRLHNLPRTMKQLRSQHSIVILDDSAPEKRILKFTPRMNEREWLIDLCLEAKPSTAAAKPEKLVHLNQLRFFTYPVLQPPLSNTRLLKCFRGFALETAKALHALHKEGIAHLDVRPFNVCFRTVEPGMGQGARAAQAVLIDLDRGTRTFKYQVQHRASCAQYARPHDWPKGVAFTSARCDWRQWALMLWSLLEPAMERVIYCEENEQLKACPLEFLNGVICKHAVGADEDLLLAEITHWIDSPEMNQAKELQADLDSSDLTTEVTLRLEGW